MQPSENVTCQCRCGATVVTSTGGGRCHSCDAPVEPLVEPPVQPVTQQDIQDAYEDVLHWPERRPRRTRTLYNDPARADISPDLARVSNTVSTDTDLTKRMELLRRQGEVLFERIVPQLNRLPPGRGRTYEEFEQICIALALFVHHLLDGDGDVDGV